MPCGRLWDLDPVRLLAALAVACFLAVPGSLPSQDGGEAWLAPYHAAWAAWVREHGETLETWNSFSSPIPPSDELVRRADGR